MAALPITQDYGIKWDSGCENVTGIIKDHPTKDHPTINSYF